MNAAFRDIVYEQPRAWLLEAREKIRDLPKTNYDLGCKFAEERKWFDAMFRFRITLYLQPNYPHAKYNLGCSYFHLGKMDHARAILKEVIRETPTNADAIFMLAAIDPNAVPPAQRPQEMPREMVVNFFTSVSAEYNIIEAQNQYRGGVAVAEVVKPLLNALAKEIIDIGCGSGIAVIPFRSEAAQIIGIDMTPAMVAQAKIAGTTEQKLYDRVIEADITKFDDRTLVETADLVLMVNVVQFIGQLTAALSNAARLLKPSALVALTIEPYASNEGFGLAAATGRFGHSSAYVKQTAAAYGLTLVKEAKVVLYAGTEGALLVFSKGSR